MPLENCQTNKQPREATQPFPSRCNQCGKRAVDMATIEYAAEVRHDGRLHAFTIANLQIPVCQTCGEKVFTDDVDRQVNDALRLHLKFLTPAKIRNALDRLDLSQKELAAIRYCRSDDLPVGERDAGPIQVDG